MGIAGAWLSFEGADTTRFYCKNCWSGLFGDHPAYGGKMVITQSPNMAGVEQMEPKSRHFLKDLTPEKLAAINNDMPWRGDPEHVYQGVSDNFLGNLANILAAGATGEQMNAQKLLEKCGPALIPDDDEELKAGPPTFMQQTAAAAER